MAGIVSTEWLAEHRTDADVLLDLRASFALYEEAHIPGAQYLHLETLRMSDGGIPCKMHHPPTLAIIFSQLGISNATRVILYASRPVDHVSATYAAWSLYATGNTNIYLLDGNYQKWASEQRPAIRAYPTIAPAHYTARLDATVFADWRYVREHLEDPDVVLVDARGRGMYEGREGVTVRLGHIPGAVMHNYIWDFHRDGTYRELDRLRKRYEHIGVTPDKEIITYCVTGREGSAAWFMLKVLLDYPRVRLYQASLTEWAAHLDLPMVIGPEAGGSLGHFRQKAA